MAVTTAFSAPEETIEKLDSLCQSLGLNRSSTISLAINKLYQAENNTSQQPAEKSTEPIN